MRENRTCGSEGGEAQLNEPSLPLSMRLRQLLIGRCLESRRRWAMASASWNRSGVLPEMVFMNG